MKKIAWFLAALLAFTFAALATDIELMPVESSLIAKVGYNAETEVLAVQMQNSSDVYLYADVPGAVFKEFLSAESKGRYFVDNIKGQYESTLKE